MTETEYRYPPAEWIQPTPVPVFTGDRNRDLLRYIRQLETAVSQANADKHSLREWRDDGE